MQADTSSILQITEYQCVLRIRVMRNVRKFFAGIAVWFLLGAGILAKAQLTATTWNPAGNPTQPSDNIWTTPGNWSGGLVPTNGYKAYFNAGAAPCVVSSTVGGCQISIGDGGPGGVLIITNGGSLSAGDNTAGNNDDYAWTAIGYSNTGEMDIENGGAVTFNYHLWIGLNPGAIGTLNMNGGTALVEGAFGLGFSGGTGIVHINGGTLTLSQWAANAIQGSGSVLDIGGWKRGHRGQSSSLGEWFYRQRQNYRLRWHWHCGVQL